jgi:hypothetical protein
VLKIEHRQQLEEGKEKKQSKSYYQKVQLIAPKEESAKVLVLNLRPFAHPVSNLIVICPTPQLLYMCL